MPETTKQMHTPGPWTIDPQDEDGWDVVTEYVDDRILVRTGLTSREADARLIAAAPELLECLHRLVAMNNCRYDRGTSDYKAAMEDAEAAIAKATAR